MLSVNQDSSMKNVVAVVLGGGRGTRLLPLTTYRSKPAVPLAGKYRLIDIPISNCLNSELNQIYVLTQFQSVSLHRHIRGTYRFDNFSGGFVEILAAQQTMDEADDERIGIKARPTPCARTCATSSQPGIDYVLILSGDQLYRMDFREMLATHEAAGPTSRSPPSRSIAREAGVARHHARRSTRAASSASWKSRKTERELNDVAMDPPWLDARGIDSGGRDCLASMGIYLFNRETLVDALEKTNYHDFGKEVFPAHRSARGTCSCTCSTATGKTSARSARSTTRTCSSPSRTRRSSWPRPRRRFTRAPARCRRRGSTARRSQHSLIADGCVIGAGTRIENSVIGLRCRIGRNVTIRNSVIMGADFYETPEQLAADRARGPAADRHRRRRGDRECDRRQELPRRAPARR